VELGIGYSVLVFFGNQQFITFEPSYKPTSIITKLYFFLTKLAAFQASGAACMKLHCASMRFRLAGTANRLNVEHPTSNVEY
jgi:hypothetical protein